MEGIVTGSRYRLSFTSGALLMREASVIAPVYLEYRDWSTVRAVVEERNLLQTRTLESGRRLAREVFQRLDVLADEEIELLAEATTSERGHLLWAAACRRYDLIGEFAEEVLRERYLLLASTLTYEDFDRFMNGKALWHAELAELRDSTKERLRRNLFKMLNEAGLLSDGRQIFGAVLSERVAAALGKSATNDMRFFPTNDGVSERVVQ